MADDIGSSVAAAGEKIASLFAVPDSVTPSVTPAQDTQTDDLAAAEQNEQSPEETSDVPEPEESEGSEPVEELEHLGKQYKVPASLKKAFEENRSAFTRYSTEAKKVELQAEQLLTQRRALEAEARFRQETKAEFDELAQLEAQIAQFKKLDWAGIQDTDTLVRTRQAYDLLRERHQDAQQGLSKKAQEFQSRQQALVSEALQKGVEYLQKAIPNFGEQVVNDIKAYGRTKGFTGAELESITDPRAVEIMYEAMQWRKLQASKPSAAQRTQGAPPVIKPSGAATQNTSAKRMEQARDHLKKSGRVEDAAALIAMRFGGKR